MIQRKTFASTEYYIGIVRKVAWKGKMMAKTGNQLLREWIQERKAEGWSNEDVAYVLHKWAREVVNGEFDEPFQ